MVWTNQVKKKILLYLSTARQRNPIQMVFWFATRTWLIQAQIQPPTLETNQTQEQINNFSRRSFVFNGCSVRFFSNLKLLKLHFWLQKRIHHKHNPIFSLRAFNSHLFMEFLVLALSDVRQSACELLNSI